MVRQAAPNPIAYSLDGAATAVGVSLDTIKRAIAAGDLTRRYPNSKPIILHEDLFEWAQTLPVERQ